MCFGCCGLAKENLAHHSLITKSSVTSIKNIHILSFLFCFVFAASMCPPELNQILNTTYFECNLCAIEKHSNNNNFNPHVTVHLKVFIHLFNCYI